MDNIPFIDDNFQEINNDSIIALNTNDKITNFIDIFY